MEIQLRCRNFQKVPAHLTLWVDDTPIIRKVSLIFDFASVSLGATNNQQCDIRKATQYCKPPFLYLLKENDRNTSSEVCCVK